MMSSLSQVSMMIATILFEEHVRASTVLFFLAGTTHFERQTFEFLAQQMARRHHNTITLKPILIPEEPRLVQPRLHFVTEKVLKDLLPKRLYEPLQSVGSDVPWREEYDYDALQEPYWQAHVYACKKMLNSNLRELLARDQIDVAVLYAGNPCQLALVWALNLPFVYIDLNGFSDETRIASGTEWMSDESNKLSLFSLKRARHTFNGNLAYFVTNIQTRLRCFIGMLCEFLAQEEPDVWLFAQLPCAKRVSLLDAPISRLFAEDDDIRQKFHGSFPSVNEIKRSADFYLANTDELLEPATRLPPNVQFVGGMHIEEARPLFLPWNKTIASALRGVIVVSFGTQTDTTRMPKYFAVSLFNVLSHLTNYHVFWRIAPKLTLPGVGDFAKSANNSLGHVPSHINFTTFIPQNELLAHHHTRLLVTNGGTHSVLEAITHGIPMLGIPLYGSNKEMLTKAKNAGIAIVIDKANVTEKSLRWAFRELLDDVRYLNNVREMSREIRRRPATAFERALNVIERAARRRGRPLFTFTLHKITRILTVLLQIHADIWLVSVMLTLLSFVVLCIILRAMFLTTFASGHLLRTFTLRFIDKIRNKSKKQFMKSEEKNK